MQNRFGIKDFLVLLLLLAILSTQWLAMIQRDRQWPLLQTVADQVRSLEERLAALDARIGQGALTTAGTTASSQSTAAPPVAPASSASWAREGVPISWQPEPGFASDPTKVPGFRVGGEWVEVFEGQPQKLTPYLYADVYGNRVVDRVCESMGTFDPKTMQLVGALADAWQIDPDGEWIRVHINERAKFSDGSPVTSEDVRWTYEDFILNPAIDADRSRSTLADILDKVEVIDDLTVEFKFKDALFTNILIALGEPILPKRYYAQFEAAQINQGTGLLMGSGPYMLEQRVATPADLAAQWTPGQDVVLVRNSNWWVGRAPLERQRFRIIKDDLARLVAYDNNEASMVLPTSPQFNALLRDRADFEKTNYALKWVNMRSGYSFIAWQCGPRGETGRMTPFVDVRVRKAMTLLLDREKMIRDIWDGIGMVAKGPFNPESPASDPSLSPLAFDPAGAALLLTAAGWEDRNKDGVLENAKGEKFEFEYTYATGGEISERIARFVSDAYRKAGIEVTTRPIDWARYQDLLKSRDFDAITLAWSANSPESDPRQTFHSESMAKGRDNFSQWSSPEADMLIEKGRRTMDPETRMLVWHELERTIAEGQPYTFIRVAPWLRLIKRNFGNVRMYKTGLSPEEYFFAGSTSSIKPGT
ncbi:MAG: hypothetical protein EXS03_03210 [Phycisphaerales bacterium]|nr:hypothetical protein [Phycisphaerales bacterium]